ncbi:putative pentatricopeptide repeat-containing protein [Tanacetum coccineum]
MAERIEALQAEVKQKLESSNAKYKVQSDKYRRMETFCVGDQGRMFDETKKALRVLVGLCKGDDVINEVVKVYKEFGFSNVVFEILLRVFVENGLVKNGLKVFDEMCGMGRVVSLGNCNALLSGLVKEGEFGDVFGVFEQMGRVGVVPDVWTCSIVVNAYCKDGKVERGVEFLRNVEEEYGVEANVVTYHSLINGYVGMGDIEGAKSVLEVMRDKGVLANVVTYTLFVKGYCKLGRLEEAEKVFRDMREEDPSLVLDVKAYGVLVDGFCRDGKMDSAVRIRDEMLEAGLNVNLFICNSMINGYCKLGEVDEAAKVVTSMSKWKLKPDSYSYNTLVDGYCREGYTAEAFKLCEKMVRDGISVSIVTYNTLLKGFCINKDIDKSLKLWHLMLKRGVMPNEIGYGTLLDGFFKVGDVERALKLWKQFLARGFQKPVIGYNTMLNGLCKMGKMAEAEQVFGKMIELGCPPDRVTYNTLADGYCKDGNMEMALKIKDTMERKPIPMSIEMYNSLITGYFKSKKSSKVTEILNEMRKKVIVPNVVTYGALISGWCREGRLDKALKTVFEMKEKGLAPNVVICSTIVSTLYRFDMNDEANMLLQKILDFDLLPGGKSFERFFEFDMGKSDVQKISNIVDGVVEGTHLSSNVVYNVAIAGLCKLGKVDDAKRFISVLLQKGFIPDNFTYCTLIHALSSAGEVDEAFKLRDEMLEKGLIPDITTYNALINGLCKSGNIDRAMRLYYKLQSKGVAPNAITYNTLIEGCNKSGNAREALKLKEKMVQECVAPSVDTYSGWFNNVHKSDEAREAAMRKSCNTARLPPGPYPFPVIGNIFELGKELHKALASLSKTYGPLMSLRLGNIITIVVSSPKIAKEILLQHDLSFSSRSVPDAGRMINHHLFSMVWLPVGDKWRRPKAKKNIQRTLSCVLIFVGKPNLADFFPLLKPFDPQGLIRKGNVYAVKLMNILDRMVDERVQARAKSSVGSSSTGHDVLDLLLDLNLKNESELSRNDILHMLLDLFAAATDTTTSTLEWAMAELLHNPEKMAKVRSELEEITDKDNVIVEESDISKLPYLNAVVKEETLRLHPPVPFLLPHKALCDVEVKGFTVPKGAQILCNVWAIGRDPSIWSEPQLFMPERFLDINVDYKGETLSSFHLVLGGECVLDCLLLIECCILC